LMRTQNSAEASSQPVAKTAPPRFGRPAHSMKGFRDNTRQRLPSHSARPPSGTRRLGMRVQAQPFPHSKGGWDSIHVWIILDSQADNGGAATSSGYFMSKKVFVSYCHRQGKWVWNRLVPCLKAGGAEVFVDRERFEAGKGVVGQMDATQDAADMSVLVLSPEYLSSPYCRHEMERAIARDPRFRKGCVIPVRRAPCALPDVIKLPNPLYVDLCNDKDSAAWKLLLDSCGADLGATAPDWLKARDDVLRFLERNQSVNLVVKGHPRYRQLIYHIRDDFQPELGIVDLYEGPTASRPGLVPKS